MFGEYYLDVIEVRLVFIKEDFYVWFFFFLEEKLKFIIIEIC